MLNEGTTLYESVYEVQHSINLLSNQSVIHPILGKTNDGISIKRLQSTRIAKRSVEINGFSLILSVFKQFFDYNAWLKFTKLDDNKQTAILKTLTIFNKEIGNSNFSVDKKIDTHWYFKRLEELSSFCNPMSNLRRDLQD